MNNAQRQARWRAANKVTHHGSLEPGVSAEVAPEPIEAAVSSNLDRCCACTRPVSDLVRVDFLRRRFSCPAQTHQANDNLRLLWLIVFGEAAGSRTP
jgi:hypothetical protein